jgi:hypothetical protein
MGGGALQGQILLGKGHIGLGASKVYINGQDATMGHFMYRF